MQGRNFGLDLLRSILMLIGVLIHASSVMSPYNTWIYSSELQLDDFSYGLIFTTHFFRMETFFLIAGFFSILVIERKGYEYFVENRKKRVLIPLIFSLLTISPIVIFFKIIFNNENISEIKLTDFIIHFWFLLTLFILSVLTYKGKLERIIYKVNSLTNLKIIFLLIIICFLNSLIAFLIIKIIGSNTLSKIYDTFIFNTIYYGFFYVLGCVFYKNKNFIASFNIFHVLFSVLFYILLFVFIQKIESTGNLVKIFKLFYSSTVVISAYITSIFLFNFFTNLKVKDNKIIRLLVDSSLVIYLFHVPILIYLSKYFDGFITNPYIYYLTICFSTYTVSFIVYFFIKKIKYLRFIYGVK